MSPAAFVTKIESAQFVDTASSTLSTKVLCIAHSSVATSCVGAIFALDKLVGSLTLPGASKHDDDDDIDDDVTASVRTVKNADASELLLVMCDGGDIGDERCDAWTRALLAHVHAELVVVCDSVSLDALHRVAAPALADSIVVRSLTPSVSPTLRAALDATPCASLVALAPLLLTGLGAAVHAARAAARFDAAAAARALHQR